ncbi:MAG: type II toxin-antitoxin system RelE/ParE family toxin [Salinimicrobium sediminis]|nr:type II toxin-antitoxin system RelE/ParE family toxin [Salinimicrobium sediminis]
MKYSVKLLPIVDYDFTTAKKWYNDQKKGLGEEFKLEVIKEISYISTSPLHYQCKYRNLRQGLVNRFPFSIFYTVEEDKMEIIIFGILHNSRDPETVEKRNKEI